MNRVWQRWITWLRVVGPPEGVGVALALVVVGVELLGTLFASLLGDGAELRHFHRARDAGLILAAVAYAVWRVACKHPALRSDYREFLERTPWRRGLALPLGPIHLVWQDAIILVVPVAVACFQPSVQPLAIVGAFLFAYLLLLGCALAVTGQYVWAYVVYFLLALAIKLLWSSGAAVLGVLAITYLLAWIALWQSLTAFPWRQALADFQNRPTRTFEKAATANPAKELSEAANNQVEATDPPPWPYALLGHTAPRRLIVPLAAWMTVGLVAWWIYAFFPPEIEAREFHPTAVLILTAGSLVAAIVRMISYVGTYHPPISLLGRFATGRIILPAYDVVLLTPLASAVAGPLAYLTAIGGGIPPAVAFSLAVALALGVALTGPPRLRQWQLTAPVRIVPTGKVKGRIEEL